MSIFGIAIAQLLLKHDYPVKGFFDNNKNFCGSRVLDLKILLPYFLKKKLKKKLSKILVIISSQSKVDLNSISAQLKRIGLKKKQIISKNFTQIFDTY